MRRVAALAPILLLLALSGIAGALDGTPPSTSGWWSQDPTAAPQPDGGFQVAGLAGEPVSIAAVRFSTPSGVTSATLSLQESGGFVTPASGLQVCTSSDPWEPANPGAYDDAPTPDCATPVTLERDAAAMVWTAPVNALLPSLGGETTFVILPAETAGGGAPLDPGFQVTFSAAALAVASAPGTTSGPSTTLAAGSLGGGGVGGTGGSTFTPPGPAAVTTTLAPTTPDSSPAAPASGEAFQPPSLAGGATPGGGGAEQPWERLLLLVPISALVGVATVYGRRVLQQRGVLEEA